jgi:Protein kinase domain
VSMATDARIGSELAGYRIETAIGRGGMGVVYRAEQLRLGRKVALKLLAPELAENAGFRARFEHESRLAAALDHPNIVPLYEAGEADGLLFISMRYVEGTDLRALLNRDGRIEPERALDIAAQVASALDAAHARGLVHRDVKPGNILIAPTVAGGPEHCYLTDFGLTKDTSSPVELTATGTFVGTIDYIAPEQIEGATPDGRGDQYALACVLFECLTGHPPFPRDQEIVVMWAHLQDEPPAVTIDRPDLPRALDAVIARAMAKASSERYPSCTALVEAARAALTPSTIPVDLTRAPARPAAVTRVGAAAPPLAAPPLARPADAGPPPAPARPTVAPTRPTVGGGRRAGLALAGVVVVVAAVAGALAGRGGDDGKAAATTTVARNGALELRYGSRWTPATYTQPVPGLQLRNPIGLRAGDGRIVAGQVADPGPGLLPAGVQPPGATEVVGLGPTPALYHTGMRASGEPAKLFVVPTDHGVQALACVRVSDEDCEAVAATLRLRGATPLDVRPNVPYAAALTKLLADRGRRAAADRRDLARARTSRVQAAQEHTAARANTLFARRARELTPPPVARQINAAIAADIARIGRVYDRLAVAATAHDAAAYRRAGSSLASSEARLAAAAGALALLGYDVQGGA